MPGRVLMIESAATLPRSGPALSTSKILSRSNHNRDGRCVILVPGQIFAHHNSEINSSPILDGLRDIHPTRSRNIVRPLSGRRYSCQGGSFLDGVDLRSSALCVKCFLGSPTPASSSSLTHHTGMSTPDVTLRLAWHVTPTRHADLVPIILLFIYPDSTLVLAT